MSRMWIVMERLPWEISGYCPEGGNGGGTLAQAPRGILVPHSARRRRRRQGAVAQTIVDGLEQERAGAAKTTTKATMCSATWRIGRQGAQTAPCQGKGGHTATQCAQSEWPMTVKFIGFSPRTLAHPTICV